MDREQEQLQFLGFVGIIRESLKIIFSRRKIFSQITVSLIAPLSFIYLFHLEFSRFVFRKAIKEQRIFNESFPIDDSQTLSDSISREWVGFWLFRAAYLILVVILSLLSTAAIVYTVACIYTANMQIGFNKVMKVVPRVWKRLMVTFTLSFGVILLYHMLAIGVLVLWIISIGSKTIGAIIGVVLLIVYIAGLLYLTIIWNLAGVVSVLEDIYGWKAMMKSRPLIKGKLGVVACILIGMSFCIGLIVLIFEDVAVSGGSTSAPGWVIRVLVGILCFLLLCKVLVLEFVIQTVIYFVCKSYHHESIDKSSLSNHLEVYLGQYERLRPPNGVQLQQIPV